MAYICSDQQQYYSLINHNNMRKLYSLMLSLQLLLATALGLSCELAAQGKLTDTNIIGHVTDAKTGEHLAGITIAIKGTTFGTATDATGHYFLKNLKQKSVTLVMRGLGYLSQERVFEVAPELLRTRSSK